MAKRKAERVVPKAGGARDDALFPRGADSRLSLAVVNRGTGEVTDLDVPGPRRTAQYALGGSYSQLSHTRTLAMVRKESGMSDADVIVFLYFACAAVETEEDGRYLDQTTDEIADALGKNRNTVGRIIAKLAKHGLLLLVRERGRVKYYRASPYITFKGSGEEHQQALASARVPTVPGVDGSKQPVPLTDNDKKLRIIKGKKK
jgi:DNA-binding transcriptional ArsR family regulator